MGVLTQIEIGAAIGSSVATLAVYLSLRFEGPNRKLLIEYLLKQDAVSSRDVLEVFGPRVFRTLRRLVRRGYLVRTPIAPRQYERDFGVRTDAIYAVSKQWRKDTDEHRRS